MFSVIMPVYNGEKFIDDAVKSVCAQTYDDWELIIVNDGSKDNTADVLKKYEINPPYRAPCKTYSNDTSLPPGITTFIY